VAPHARASLATGETIDEFDKILVERYSFIVDFALQTITDPTVKRRRDYLYELAGTSLWRLPTLLDASQFLDYKILIGRTADDAILRRVARVLETHCDETRLVPAIVFQPQTGLSTLRLVLQR